MGGGGRKESCPGIAWRRPTLLVYVGGGKERGEGGEEGSKKKKGKRKRPSDMLFGAGASGLVGKKRGDLGKKGEGIPGNVVFPRCPCPGGVKGKKKRGGGGKNFTEGEGGRRKGPLSRSRPPAHLPHLGPHKEEKKKEEIFNTKKGKGKRGEGGEEKVVISLTSMGALCHLPANRSDLRGKRKKGGKKRESLGEEKGGGGERKRI